MKILFFTENTHSGGMDSVIISLFNEWPGAQDELVLVCNEDHPGLDNIAKLIRRPFQMIRHNVFSYRKLISLTQNNRFLSLLRRILSPLLRYVCFDISVWTTRSLIKKQHPDRVVVVNGGYPGGDTCRAAVVGWGMFNSRDKAVLNIHNFATRPRWFEWLQEGLVDLFVARYTRQIITVSKTCAVSLKIRSFLRFNETHVVYNGLPEFVGEKEGGDLKKELGLGEDTKICLMLGTYEPRKGHSFLIDAFQKVAVQVSEAHLVICGYGTHDEFAAVNDLVAASGLSSKIHLMGFRNDVSLLLKQCDVLAVPSQSFESFGLTAVEAMACRVPVVATKVGGIVEVVKDEQGGFCFEPADADGFAGALVRFLQDAAFRCEQGERGYLRYKELFLCDKMAAQYHSLVCKSR